MIKPTIYSLFIIGGTKISGLLRDMLVIALLGFSSESDSVFISMTVLMFFQLISYHTAINRLGYLKNGTMLDNLMKDWRYALLLIFVTLIVQSVVFYLFSDVSHMLKYILLFTAISPIAIAIGYGCACRVLEGNRNSHVVATTIQNLILLTAFPLIMYGSDANMLFLSWTAAWSVSYIYLIFSKNSNTSEECFIKSESLSNNVSFILVLAPMVMFSTVLSERFFYSFTEGSLALIKVLETITMSIIFLLEILILNKILAVVKKKYSASGMGVDIMNLVISGFFKSLFVGVVMYIAIVYFVFNIKDNFTVLSTLSDEMVAFLIPASILYGVYFIAALARDYSDRLIYLSNKSMIVFRANVLVFAFTIIANLLFIEYAPYTVLITSVFLLSMKSLYNFIFLKTNASNREII